MGRGGRVRGCVADAVDEMRKGKSEERKGKSEERKGKSEERKGKKRGKERYRRDRYLVGKVKEINQDNVFDLVFGFLFVIG